MLSKCGSVRREKCFLKFAKQFRPTPAKLRSALVIGQIALAVILVSGAGLMLRTFMNLLSTDTGYKADHVVYAITVLPASRYPKRVDVELFYNKVLNQLRATAWR